MAVMIVKYSRVDFPQYLVTLKIWQYGTISDVPTSRNWMPANLPGLIVVRTVLTLFI